MKKTSIIKYFLVAGIVIYSLLSAFYPPIVSAQGIDQAVDLVIEAMPSDPLPGQSVILEAKSYSIDVSQYFLSWTYAGASAGSGTGKTKIAVKAPAAGVSSTAMVTLSGSDTGEVSAAIFLRPASVDLLWEGVDAAVPPFYKGRPLLAPGGTFRIVAVPASGAPVQASFSWNQNGKALPALSGAGKRSITLTNNILNAREQISVVANGGLFQGQNKATILPQSPYIVAYERKEGFVDYGNGTTTALITGNPGAVIRFEPFFFTLQNGVSRDLSFVVRSGNDQIIGENEQNEIRLSRPEGGGEVDISVEATTNTYSVQNARRTFKVLFE